MKKQPNKITLHSNNAENLLAIVYLMKEKANDVMKWEISYSPHRSWRKTHKLVVEVLER